jgi:hypothetical protein
MTEMTLLHPGDRFPALAVALPGGSTLQLRAGATFPIVTLRPILRGDKRRGERNKTSP